MTGPTERREDRGAGAPAAGPQDGLGSLPRGFPDPRTGQGATQGEGRGEAPVAPTAPVPVPASASAAGRAAGREVRRADGAAPGGRGRPMRVLIVDDEYPARAELRFRLSREPGVEITGEAATAREALRLIDALDYDVVFLDIAMPGLSGLELAERLKQRPHAPYVIFTTAYDEYAVKAFEARALDYLLKPFSDERLREALDRVRERLAPVAEERDGAGTGVAAGAARQAGRGDGGPGETAAAPGGAGAGGPVPAGLGAGAGAPPGAATRGRVRPRWVMGVRDEAAVPIPVEEVVYAEAENDQVFVYTASHRYPTRYTLRELEDLLPPDRFFRCHRGYIVNLRKVREISPFFNGTYNLTVVHAGQPVTIPVARSRVPELKRHFWPETG